MQVHSEHYFVVNSSTRTEKHAIYDPSIFMRENFFSQGFIDGSPDSMMAVMSKVGKVEGKSCWQRRCGYSLTVLLCM